MSRGENSFTADTSQQADVHITREGRSYIDLGSPESVKAVLCKAEQYSKIKIVQDTAKTPEPA